MSGQTRRVDRGRGHSYLLDGEKVPGVTTIISNGLPKPALVKWGMNTTAAYAVDNWDDLAAMPPSKRLDVLKGAAYGDRDRAAVRGTEVHALAEKLVQGAEVEVPDHLAGHVEAYVRFLDDWQPEPVWVERPVFSRKWRYGGTFDLIADVPGLGRALLDVKTSKGVYGDVALQLSAYGHADFLLDGDGNEQAIPSIDFYGVIHVRADGVDLYPFDVSERTYKAFLYCAQVAKFAETSRDLVGSPLTPARDAA